MIFEDERLFTLDGELIQFIAGGDTVIPYQALRHDDIPVNFNLPNTVIKWYLVPFGEPKVHTIEKTSTDGGIVIDPQQVGRFDVKLSAAETAELSNVYTYQVEITDPDGNIFRDIQGYVHVWARNVGASS